jgi:hypothetical protein
MDVISLGIFALVNDGIANYVHGPTNQNRDSSEVEGQHQHNHGA